ncbi:MAG TPA: DUF4012 domain-containing protein [Mycobacteriales bacterium]|nr:DUF4012 domain-containing protein [Mycobacteriales bacterium]
MTASGDASSSRRRSFVFWALGFVGLLLLAIAWLAFRALQIDSNLQSARTALTNAESSLHDARPVDQGLVHSAQSHTRTALDAARDPVWSAASHVPWLGRPLRTTTGIAKVGDRITHQSLPALLAIDDQLQKVKTADALHALPLPAMRTVGMALTTVDGQLRDDVDEVRHLSASYVGPLNDARSKLLGQLSRISAQVHSAAVATTVGVPMLGGDGPRRYFVMFENPAEARPDMGLFGGYAEVLASNGHLHVVTSGTNTDLPKMRVPAGAPSVAAGYTDLGAGKDWRSSNLSPDFGEDAGLMGAAYATVTGRAIDGVIALDPVAMGRIEQVAGRSVTVPNAGTYTGGSLAMFLENGEYGLPLTRAQRKVLLLAVGRQSMDALLASHVSALNLARALGALAGGGHLRLYSTHASEQSQLAGLPIAGTLPTTTQPFVGVYVTNASATKLDYYLDESIAYDGTSCKPATATVRVTLTNSVPERGVPALVTSGNVAASSAAQRNVNRVLMSVVISPGARVVDATLAGRQVSWTLKTVERGGHPAYLTYVDLPPRTPQTVTLSLAQPGVRGAAVIGTQPLPREPTASVSGAVC